MKTNLQNRLLNRSTIAASLFALASASTLCAADQTSTNSASSSTGDTIQATPVDSTDEETGLTFDNGATMSSAITAELEGSQNVNIRTTKNTDSGTLTITGPVTMSGTGSDNWFRPDGRILFQDTTVTLTNVGLVLGYKNGAIYEFLNSTVNITSEAVSGDKRGLHIAGGTINISNSTITTPFALISNGGGATLNMTSGTFSTDQLAMGPYNDGKIGTLNLDGGTIELRELTRYNDGPGCASTVDLNLNGGVLKALGDNANFINSADGLITNANVMELGAKIDTNGFDIEIPVALVCGVLGDGGLLKSGDGTLTLSVANAYTGMTMVSGGTLATAGAGALGSGDIIISKGAMLQLGNANSIADTANLKLDSNSSLDLDHTGIEIVKSLSSVSGKFIGVGTYSATDLSRFFGSSFAFRGTGRLQVLSASGGASRPAAAAR